MSRTTVLMLFGIAVCVGSVLLLYSFSSTSTSLSRYEQPQQQLYEQPQQQQQQQQRHPPPRTQHKPPKAPVDMMDMQIEEDDMALKPPIDDSVAPPPMLVCPQPTPLVCPTPEPLPPPMHQPPPPRPHSPSSSHNDEVIRELTETCKERVNSLQQYPLHESLKKGRIIVEYAGLFETGGPAALHELHFATVRLGFDGLYHFINPSYVVDASVARTLPSFNIPHDVQPNDLVIFPENSGVPLYEGIRSKGGKVGIYMLGLHTPISNPNLYRTDVYWIPSSFYTRELFLAPGKQLMLSPVEDHYYKNREAGIVAAGGDSTPFRSRKTKLVFVDNDVDGSVHEIVRSIPDAQLRVLSGIPRKEVPEVYKDAVVTIDTHLPGVERINFEGALLDCLTLVTEQLNGQDLVDFPIDPRLKLDFSSKEQMRQLIYNAVHHTEELRPFFDGMRDFTVMQRELFARHGLSLFGSRMIHFHIPLPNAESDAFIWPFISTALANYPMSSIDMVTPAMDRLLYKYQMLIKMWDLTNSRSVARIVVQPCATADCVLQHPPTFSDRIIVSTMPTNWFVGDQAVNYLAHVLHDQELNPWHDDGFFVVTPEALAECSGNSDVLSSNVLVAKSEKYAHVRDKGISLTKTPELDTTAQAKMAAFIASPLCPLLAEQIINVRPFAYDEQHAPKRPNCAPYNLYDSMFHASPKHFVGLYADHVQRTLERIHTMFPPTSYHQPSWFHRPIDYPRFTGKLHPAP